MGGVDKLSSLLAVRSFAEKYGVETLNGIVLLQP